MAKMDSTGTPIVTLLIHQLPYQSANNKDNGNHPTPTFPRLEMDVSYELHLQFNWLGPQEELRIVFRTHWKITFSFLFPRSSQKQFRA